MKQVNQNFFKEWNNDMAYIFGYWFADGHISNPNMPSWKNYEFIITSKDIKHLYLIRRLMNSNHKINDKKEKQ